MLCSSGFELHSRWVPLKNPHMMLLLLWLSKLIIPEDGSPSFGLDEFELPRT